MFEHFIGRLDPGNLESKAGGEGLQLTQGSNMDGRVRKPMLFIEKKSKYIMKTQTIDTVLVSTSRALNHGIKFSRKIQRGPHFTSFVSEKPNPNELLRVRVKHHKESLLIEGLMLFGLISDREDTRLFDFTAFFFLRGNITE